MNYLNGIYVVFSFSCKIYILSVTRYWFLSDDMQNYMETEQLSGISALHQWKKPFAIGGLVKNNWKKMMIFRDFKGQFGFINK